LVPDQLDGPVRVGDKATRERLVSGLMLLASSYAPTGTIADRTNGDVSGGR